MANGVHIKLASVVVGSALAASVTLCENALAHNRHDNLTAQDHMVTTIIDKAVIGGDIEHDSDGNLTFDDKGNVKFNYSGNIFSVGTDPNTGELKKLKNTIGTIEGQAAFPMDFVYMSAMINGLMTKMANGEQVTMPKMPPIIPWTCNHCRMVVADSTYVSIVDALDPQYGDPDMIAKFDEMLEGGAAGALEAMRLDGRAFMGVTPASFDPVAKTMSIRMAGCSAVVGVEGSNAGKLGTVCLNSTATFDVSGAALDENGSLIASTITATGTSNCVTILHTPTM